MSVSRKSKFNRNAGIAAIQICWKQMSPDGERVYSPHYDVDALVDLCRAGRFDEREDWCEETRQ